MGTKPSEPEPEWLQRQERSNETILRLMVRISLFAGRPIARIVLHGIAIYFVLFAPAARRSSRAYLTRILGRWANWQDGYRHVFSFASTIHDRVYLLNDRFNIFDIKVHGELSELHALQQGSGAILMGAHLGSFEVLRAIGQDEVGLRIAVLMYEQNARKLNGALAAINPKATQEIICLGEMQSMLKVRDKLDQGFFVGILADRSLGNDATILVDFLGEPAAFPLGPWQMAAMLKRPVFLMAGLYMGANRYELHFEPLADFSQIKREERDAAIAAGVQAYANSIARLCKLAPYNWFNFFDFWKK